MGPTEQGTTKQPKQECGSGGTTDEVVANILPSLFLGQGRDEAKGKCSGRDGGGRFGGARVLWHRGGEGGGRCVLQEGMMCTPDSGPDVATAEWDSLP